ncbi:uncharacterized protein LOC118348227 [Juglans regia]|uniref:Uncharacterized protein LOC118348227 n=1 Tax=Juglans regia TaxID=51240 RepID=A0A6P9ECM3_JUGRE|nr:uncharacterized protein LOC118348227 [Juglans regia]
MEVEDKLVWSYDEKGQFSVKSAYILEFDSKRAKRGETSRVREVDRRWKDMWKLKVPEKVKLFMWKAGNEILPTRRNLQLRKIVEDSICPICKEIEETVMHVIWQCPAASDVWAEFNKILQKWSLNEDDLLSLWKKLVDKVGKAEMGEIASVMREIRNQVWKKPRESFIKANWDATVDQKEKKMRIGVMIRDEEGEVLVVVEGHQRNVDQPAVAKSYALWKGDAQLIVKAVNNQEEDRSVYGSIVEASKKLISSWKDWSVEFVYRNANEAAHTLAKEALHLDTEIVWIEETPNCIRNITERERTCKEGSCLYQ